MHRSRLDPVPKIFNVKPVTRIDPQTFENMAQQVRSPLYADVAQQQPTLNSPTSAENSEGARVNIRVEKVSKYLLFVV